MDKLYPGIGIIGNERLSGIYGMNEGIIDGKGTGVQHLFFDSFDIDLIHSACTLVKIGNTIYYGNRKESRGGHQIHLKAEYSNIDDGFLITDIFDDGIIRKKDKACSFDSSKLAFDFNYINLSKESINIEIYTYLILRNRVNIEAKIIGNKVLAKVGDTYIGIKTSDAGNSYLIEESPTGFLYRTTNAILYDEKKSKNINTNNMLGILIGHKQTLKSNEEKNFKWGVIFGKNEKEVNIQLDLYELENYYKDASDYWNSYLSKGYMTSSNR